jgi:hypothetical protein
MKKLTTFTAAAILFAAATSAMTGCEAAQKAADQCGFSCNENALVEGQVSISGVANIDAFFAQVANFKATTTLVADGLTAPIARINAQLGLPATAGGAEVAAAIKTQFQLEGALKIDYAPPKCEISAKATVEAAAKCDVEASGGKLEASCEGRCEADVQVSGGQVSCSGGATVKCSAPSVSAACTGSCKGSCTLEAAAECSGTCSGTCSGKCDGTCDGAATGTAGGIDCAGKCEGSCTGGGCTGKCELAAGGSCTGKCDGDCSIEATGGKCDASAKVECFAEPPKGSASVKCEGKCEGAIEPPAVKAECQASAKADAELKAECTPPAIEVTANFAATASVDAKARFATFLEVYQTEMGSIVANLRRSDVVLKAGASMIGSVKDVGDAFAKALPEAKGDLKVAAGLACAGKLMPQVATQIGDSAGKLKTSVSGAASYVAAFK